MIVFCSIHLLFQVMIIFKLAQPYFRLWSLSTPDWTIFHNMDNNLKILKSAFEASNLSKREYAEKLGVSASHISDILNGKGKGSNSLAELAKLRFLTKPQSSKEEEAMYRVKYEEAQAEIIALQKIIIDAGLTQKKDRSLAKKKSG